MSSLKLLDDKVACSLPGRIKQEIRKTEPRGYARLLKLAKHVAGKVWPRKQVICFFFFLAVLGLRCCARAFSSCGERGLLFLAVRGLLRAVALGAQ